MPRRPMTDAEKAEAKQRREAQQALLNAIPEAAPMFYEAPEGYTAKGERDGIQREYDDAVRASFDAERWMIVPVTHVDEMPRMIARLRSAGDFHTLTVRIKQGTHPETNGPTLEFLARPKVRKPRTKGNVE